MIGVGIAPITQPKAPAPVARQHRPTGRTARCGGPARAVVRPPRSPPAPAVARIPTPARVETRVPGAPDQLPANPLAQFDLNDVESFIDCTLIETDADVPIHVAGASPEDRSRSLPTFMRGRSGGAGLGSEPREEVAAALPGPAVRAAPYAPYAAIAVISIVVGAIIGHSGKRTPPAAADRPCR